MKVEPARVIILHVGDAQYPQEELGKVIKKAADGVRSLSSAHVVGTCTIMDDESADLAAEKVSEWKFDAIIVNFVSWHITPFVMRTLKDYRHLPILVWGIGGWYDENHKLFAPAAAAGTTAIAPLLREMGYSFMLINEKPGAELSLDKVDRFLRAAGAAKAIRHSRIGLFGYADMGLYTCAYNKTLLLDRLGVDIEDYFVHDLLKQMEEFPENEVKTAVEEIKRDAVFTNKIQDSVLEKVTRLYLVMKGTKDRRGLDAVSIKCVNGVTGQMGFNPCLAQTLLASKDTTVVCECDAYGMLTGMMFSGVTGHGAAFVENYEVFDDTVLVGVCGFVPKDFIEGDLRIRSANLGEFNTGISNVSKMKTGTVTYGRLYESHGNFRMFVKKGEALPNPKWTEAGWCEPTPDFPSVLLQPGMAVQKYLETVPGQHIIMVYGDWEADIRLFCEFMGIPVDD